MKLIENKKFFLIAEIGNNHEGSIKNAIKLVKQAKISGADAVKFQTFIINDYIHINQKERYSRLKKFQLTFNQFLHLKKLSHKLGLKFISTPLDLKSAKFISQISDAVKIASGDNDNFDLIKEAAKKCKSLIISTGFADIRLTKKIYNFIKSIKGKDFVKNNFSLLHCTSSYPAKLNDTNLSAIKIMQKKFDCEIGLSDHTTGIESCFYAAFMGVRIFEKHFTLSNTFSSFIDHKVSLNPKNFKNLRKKLNDAQIVLGDGIKKLQECEEKFLLNSKRSLVAKCNLKKGTKLNKKYFKVIRPGYPDSIDINFNFKNISLRENLVKNQHLSIFHIKD